MTSIPQFDVISVPKNGTLHLIFSKNRLIKLYTDTKEITCSNCSLETTQEYRIYNTTRKMNINITNTLEEDLSLATKNISLSTKNENIRSYNNSSNTLFDIETRYPIVSVDWKTALENYSNTEITLSHVPELTNIIDSFYQSGQIIFARAQRLLRIANNLIKINNFSIFAPYEKSPLNTSNDEGVIAAAHAKLLLEIFMDLVERDKQLSTLVKHSGIISSQPRNLDIYRYDETDKIIDRYRKMDIYVSKSSKCLSILYINHTSKNIINNTKSYMSALYCNQVEHIINAIYQNYTSNLLAWLDRINQLYPNVSTESTKIPYGYELANMIVKRKKLQSDPSLLISNTIDDKIKELSPIIGINHSLETIFVIAGILQYNSSSGIKTAPVDLSFYNNHTDYIGEYVRDYLKFCKNYIMVYYTIKKKLLNANKITIQPNSLTAFSNVKDVTSPSIKTIAETVPIKTNPKPLDSVKRDIIQSYKITSFININCDIYTKTLVYTTIVILLGLLMIKITKEMIRH